MEFGQFSISLPVKDMQASLAFYEKLGFEVVDGGHMREQMPDGDGTAWRILKRPEAVIGLFQGMFEETIMTFNPTDVRSLQATLEANGVTPVMRAEGEAGPAHSILKDPDGYTILLDQHA